MIRIAYLSTGAIVPFCRDGARAWRSNADASIQDLDAVQILTWGTLEPQPNTQYYCYDCQNEIETELTAKALAPIVERRMTAPIYEIARNFAAMFAEEGDDE